MSATAPTTTVRAIVTGALLGGLIAAANVYVGLKIGFTDSGSITAVIVAFALFSIVSRPSALEINLVQTVAVSAASMTCTAGLIGPVPALAMSGKPLAPLAIAGWGIALGVFGTLVVAPFRQAFLPLPFPSGRATAEVIQALGGGERGRARALGVGALGAGVITVLRDALGLIPGGAMIPGTFLGVAASPLLIAAGMLAGLTIGLSLFAGALIAWQVLAPMLVERKLVASEGYVDVLGWLLWPGVGLMVSSSLTSILLDARSYLRGGIERTALPRWWLPAVLAAGGAVFLTSAWAFELSPLVALLALALAVVVTIVGARSLGETDTTPSGPMGGLTQVVVGPLTQGIASPIGAGGVVSGAMNQGAQLIEAWKVGAILGDRPGRQLVAYLVGVFAGVAAAVPAYLVVVKAYGLGSEALPAADPLSWKATAEVVQRGLGALPAGVALAAGLAAGLGVLLAVLQRTRARRFVPSPVALGIAFVIPAQYSVTIAIGGVLLWLWPRSRSRLVVPLASGVIAGESLVGIVLAVIAVLS